MIDALMTIAFALGVGWVVARLALMVPDSWLAWLIPVSVEQLPEDDS